MLVCVARIFVEIDEYCDDKVTETLSGGCKHDHLSSTPSLYVRNADHGEYEVGDAVASSKESSHLVAEADRLYQDSRQVVTTLLLVLKTCIGGNGLLVEAKT